MAPIYILFDGAFTLKNKTSKKSFLKRSTLSLALYTALGFSLDAVGGEYFYTTQDDFVAIAKSQSQTEPKNILTIDTISHPRQIVDNYHSAVKNNSDSKTDSVQAYSLERLLEAISDPSKLDAPFDRIDLLAHGYPGKIVFGNDWPLTATELEEKLRNVDLSHLTHEGSELDIWSCNLGSNVEKECLGDDMIKILAKKFLPHGGRIITSPRVIRTTGFETVVIPYLSGVYNLKSGVMIPLVSVLATKGKIEPRLIIWDFKPGQEPTKTEIP